MEKEKTLIDIDNLLTRGVGEFIDPDGVFKEKLEKKAKGEYLGDIIIKFGVDPTRPDIHLGHAVVFRKLRQFQELGCKVVFLVGDFTTTIGDPTGKSKIRPEIDQKEIEYNMKTYLDQIGKLLMTDPEHFSWIRNSDWFHDVSDLVVPKQVYVNSTKPNGEKSGTVVFPPNSFMAKAVVFDSTRMQKTHLRKQEIIDVTLRGLVWTLRHITHSSLIERDMFQERLKKGDELYMSEMLYPVFQGIDSYVIARLYGSCDIEVGGTDQTFNMMLGRDVMKANKQKPQSVLTIDLLEGTDGKEKMSKSLDNYIGITDNPNDMFGKIMSVPDNLIVRYFNLCTYTPKDDIEDIKNKLDAGKTNPRDIKIRLAHEIVTMYHGDAKADKAKEVFIDTFQKKNIPEDIKEVVISKETPLIDIVLEEGLVSSKSDFRRLQKEGAVKIITNEKEEKIPNADITISESTAVKLGKRRFIKIIMK